MVRPHLPASFLWIYRALLFFVSRKWFDRMSGLTVHPRFFFLRFFFWKGVAGAARQASRGDAGGHGGDREEEQQARRPVEELPGDRCHDRLQQVQEYHGRDAAVMQVMAPPSPRQTFMGSIAPRTTEKGYL